jgi:NADPH-dependent 2,4-dienoyl-CoA reductase/sulfur reductase-like enzyme
VVAAGFLAVGSGPAGLTAAETFRRKHPTIPVRILPSDPALPHAKPHLSKAFLIGCEAASCLADRGVTTTLVAPESVPVQRRFGVEVGERVAKMLSDIGVRFIGSTSVAAVDDGGVTMDTGSAVEADLVVCATGVRSDSRLAIDAGLELADERVVVDDPSEHWRDAREQGRVAGAVAAGSVASWVTVPGSEVVGVLTATANRGA